jgi:hypothetical protein
VFVCLFVSLFVCLSVRVFVECCCWLQHRGLFLLDNIRRMDGDEKGVKTAHLIRCLLSLSLALLFPTFSRRKMARLTNKEGTHWQLTGPPQPNCIHTFTPTIPLSFPLSCPRTLISLSPIQYRSDNGSFIFSTRTSPLSLTYLPSRFGSLYAVHPYCTTAFWLYAISHTSLAFHRSKKAP